KFTERGCVAADVRAIETDGSATIVRVDVVDTGIGISDDARRRLFSKFSQADGTIARRFGGSGLGLTICKQLVEIMGGEINVESEPGKGSRFWFTVRLAADAGQQPRPAAPVEHLAGVRTLVVDDVALNRQILRRQLEGWEMQVTEAADLDHALMELRHAVQQGSPFQIALIDHQLAGQDGEDLARQIRANPALTSTRLVLASSIGLPSENSTARAVFDALLQKPIRGQVLVDCLCRLVAPLPVTPVGATNPTKSTEAQGNLSTPRDGSMPMQTSISVAAPDAAPQSKGKRILLAEDNKVNQRLAVMLLGKAGYEIDTVENGVEAIEALQRQAYDLVLMDVQMPSMDGVEATRRIRKLGDEKAKVPIVAMTAHAMQGAREEYLAAGMNDYVSKPIDRNVLLATIERWIVGPLNSTAGAAGAAQSGEAELPILDDSQLATIEEAVPLNEFRSLVEEFLDGATQRVDRIKALMEQGDLAQIARESHDLVSTAGNFGARRMQALARRLEGACKAANAVKAGKLVQEVLVAAPPSWAAVRTRFLARSA
ncbi:MAG: response regulator, partial [Proteobacteria bacterium]|nr:response regulator [Pseudomonadota bacterium]